MKSIFGKIKGPFRTILYWPFFTIAFFLVIVVGLVGPHMALCIHNVCIGIAYIFPAQTWCNDSEYGGFCIGICTDAEETVGWFFCTIWAGG